MIYAYLDWNVFDRLEKKDTLDLEQQKTFKSIETMIIEKQIISPYSNAHINDLIRGHAKNPDFIPRHLKTLKSFSNDLCIVQYWGNDQTIWHYREVEEFFSSALEEKDFASKSFTELMDWDKTGIWQLRLNMLRLTPVHDNFKQIYKVNPVFNQIFPKTKNQLNLLSFCEDLYDFSNNVKKDYSLYKSLRKYINQAFARLKDKQKVIKEFDNSTSEAPAYLSLNDALEKYDPKNKTSDNPAFQKITDTYIKLDLKGYKADEKFSNLIDDALHVFYGAHCDYFITIDDKCHYKAAETYHRLGITTRAMKPKEFVQHLDVSTNQSL